MAAAELQPSDIAYPIRTIVRNQRNTTFRLGTVSSIDLDSRTVVLEDGQLVYDYLVLAPGSHTRHFGVEGAAEHSFGLRTLDDALALRNHLLRSFEAATASLDRAEQRRLLTFAIVGGGPTGVEFAGALQEFLNGPFAKDFGNALDTPARVVLVEAGDRLLTMYPERLSRYAAKRLGRMGVDVRLGVSVVAVTLEGFTNRNGDDPVCGSRVDGRRRRGPQLPNLGVPRRSGRRRSGSPPISPWTAVPRSS